RPVPATGIDLRADAEVDVGVTVKIGEDQVAFVGLVLRDRHIPGQHQAKFPGVRLAVPAGRVVPVQIHAAERSWVLLVWDTSTDNYCPHKRPQGPSAPVRWKY